MIELRDYQRDLLEQVQQALAPKGAGVMMQLPTGGQDGHRHTPAKQAMYTLATTI